MIKKLLISLGLLILSAILIFFIAFKVQHSEKSWHIKEINDFLDDLESNYFYIKKTDVVEKYSHVTIKIYFNGHKDFQYDESLYSDLKDFLMRRDIQEKILEKQAADWPATELFFPRIRIDFIDTASLGSHYIDVSPSDVTYSSSNLLNNGYKKWSPVIYYVTKDETK